MEDWAKLKVVDLKAELKRRGLPQHGLKVELVARLNDADQEESPEEGSKEEHPVDDELLPDASKPTADEPVAHSENATPSNDEPPKNTTITEIVEDAAAPGGSTGDAPAAPVADQSAPKSPRQNDPQSPSPLTPVPDQTPAKDIAVDDSANDSSPEAQKRKRRSASFAPEEETSRKRVRAEDEPIAASVAHAASPRGRDTRNGDDVDTEDVATRGASATTPPQPAENKSGEEDPEAMDYDRDVAPALHPATSALYITNLMRPLRPAEMQSHLATLATPPGAAVNDDIVTVFYLDQIRTHAFAAFASASAASRVRMLLHDRIWPNESNRKALWVDFIPPDKVTSWTEMEESSGRGRPGSRWEVIYENGPDGVMEARLTSGAMSSARSGPPPGRQPVPASSDGPNAIPLGPRGHREVGAPPKGPRADRSGAASGHRPPPDAFEDTDRTHTRPSISYQLVSEELAQRRIDNMRSFYTQDTARDLGREINRYSFENGDSFVDRGKEVFEGIRPPHRERAVERERRGGGRGRGRGGFSGRGPRRGGFGPPSDRYLPSFNGGRDDRRPRFDDGGRPPRFDNRPPRFENRPPRFDDRPPPRFDDRDSFADRDSRY